MLSGQCCQREVSEGSLLSVLGRSAAGDGITGRISERRALEVKRNL